jgi:hypothetical protein
MGMPRRLHDFSVTLVTDGAEYKSLVERSPAGQGQGRFTPPIQRTELEPLRRQLSAEVPASGHLRDIRPVAEAVVPRYEPKMVGKGIGDGLFTGNVELLHT